MTPQLLASLAQMLAADSVTIDDVSARVGRAIDDPGAPLPIVLEPTLPGVSDARLWRYPETGAPYVLKVDPSIDRRPRLADLEREFGAAEAIPADRGRPETVLFARIARGAKWAVSAIAELDSATARVASVKLRRDPND